MTTKKQFYTDCVSANGSDIEEMMETAKEVSFKTICSHIDGGAKTLDEMFGTCPPISKDWSVLFFTGKFQGKKCAIVKHSAIEYVFI